MLDRLRFYVPWAWRFAVLQQQPPLILGLIVTDRCNLACTECRIANAGMGDMPFDQISTVLADAFERGFRELYISGGEPMMWRDGSHTIEDVVTLARGLGYYHVHIYTNGTFPLESGADMLWVSCDGLPGTYELHSGDHFEEVRANIFASSHPSLASVYVLSTLTRAGLRPFLETVRDERWPLRGVMVYLHTPYYGKDELLIDASERPAAVAEMLEMKRDGLPLLNSGAGLKALASGDWPRRHNTWHIVDAAGEYVCCRADDTVCPDCGYGACTEVTMAQRFRPSALAGLVRMW